MQTLLNEFVRQLILQIAHVFSNCFIKVIKIHFYYLNALRYALS